MRSSRNPRSLLFVPADEERKIKNSLVASADAIVLDLEDSIVPERKQLARDGCGMQVLRGSSLPSILVRINSPRSEWFEEDLKVIREIQPDGVLVPKCESARDIRAVTNTLGADAGDPILDVYPMVESPIGLLRAEEIVTASNWVVGIAFGAEDFCVDMDICRTAGEPELMPARCTLITVAKAYGLAAIDSPSLALDREDEIRSDAVRAHALGFTGKFGIHPRQIPILNEVFSPSVKEVEEAREMLEKAGTQGEGVFRWNGRMVDEAVLRRARCILERHRALRASDS